MSNTANRCRQIVVVGCGNAWRRDDGLGIAAVHMLADCLARARCRAVKPAAAAFAAFELESPASVTNVQLIETDCPARTALECLAGIDRAIIVDAIMAGGTPGAIYRLEGKELEAAVDRAKSGTACSLSYHNTDVLSTLALLELLCPERLPGAVTVCGIEPESLAMGRGLTSRVAAVLPELVGQIRRELGSLQAA